MDPFPKTSATTVKKTTHFRILWANAYCLMDTSSGASMAVREMLLQLAARGIDVEIIGATVFDAATGLSRIQPHWAAVQAATSDVVVVQDSLLRHQLVKTSSIERKRMTSQEEGTWLQFYCKALDERPPDLVFYFGGQVMDLLIPDEAKARGIPSVAYLANGNFKNTRWCRDVSLILTDSHATANMYRQRLGVRPVPIGAFIDPALVTASEPTRQRLLFVNPTLSKGAALVIRLALALEKRRPDIVIEVVESRGKWRDVLEQMTAAWGEPRTALSNVVVTANTSDMRPIYARARVLLAPSLWWESFGRVVAEAMLNGIPAIVTQRGGLPEVIGKAGVTLQLQEQSYQPPYSQVPSAQQLLPVLERIERLFDDEALYQTYVEWAYEQGKQHRIERSTQRLLEALTPLVRERRRPCHNAHVHAQPTNVRSVVLHSFMGGPRSMGRVGYYAFQHLVARGYETHFLPFANDSMSASWNEAIKRRITQTPATLNADQQVQFCSVLEARQTRYAHYVTPWFFHDVDGLPASIVADINTNDRVYASSGFVRDIFIRYGVKVPVDVLHMGYDARHYHFVERSLSTPFTFLCVAEPTPRKNLGMLITAFQQAFGKRKDVRLLIKIALHDAASLRQQVGNAPNIHIDARRLVNERDMAQLYQQAHCFVLASRFEGFGMPYLEAMATGLPVIATHYSGHLDFCRADNSYLIDVKRMVEADTTCFPHLPGWWAEPNEAHIIALMRDVFEDYERALAVGRRGYESVAGEWTWEARLDRHFPVAAPSPTGEKK